MPTWRPAYIHIGQAKWPDPAAGGQGKPLWTDQRDWLVRLRLARRQALVETSAAFIAGGADVEVVCRELADRIARLLCATCLIRPLDGGRSELPVALAQAAEAAQLELGRLIATEPHALAAACSVRAAEMRSSLLLPQVSTKCLRLWSKAVACTALDEVSIRSMLVAPILADKRVVGSIVVWRDAAGPPLQEDDRAFVDEVARRLASGYG